MGIGGQHFGHLSEMGVWSWQAPLQLANLTQDRKGVVLEGLSPEWGCQPVKWGVGTGPGKEAPAHEMRKLLAGLGPPMRWGRGAVREVRIPPLRRGLVRGAVVSCLRRTGLGP